MFYSISVLHNLDCFLGIIIFIMFAIGGFCIVQLGLKYVDSDNYDRAMESFIAWKAFLAKYLKSYLAIFFSISIMSCLIPSSLTMYSLVGINYLSDSKIPEKVVQLVNLKLDEYISSQIPSKDKK